jgi:hypothetical protein
MDGFKAIERNEKELRKKIKIVKTVSKDIKMEFGPQKCAMKETTDHLTSGCLILAKSEYIIRHDKLCTHLHYSKYMKLGTKTAENWRSHIHTPASEH